MRTNIELDDDLVAEAQKYSSTRTKRALVEEALVAFIAMKAEERRRRSYRDRLNALQTKTRDIRLRSDVRDIIRDNREFR